MPDRIADLVPTTELEAVNAMLAISGENPVENLEDPLPANVEFALNLIRRVARGVLSRGWHFNTVREVVLVPDVNEGFTVAIPEDALRVRKSPLASQRSWDVSWRGGFLWNNLINSDSFDGDDYAGGIRVDISYAINFTDMPEAARQYIMVMAGRRYQEQGLGNAEISGYGQKDEDLALQNLIDAEGLIEDTNSILNFADQRKAQAVFDTVSRLVQAEGWHFNTRKEWSIAPDGDGHIVLPEETLRVQLSRTKSQPSTLNVAHRGSYLYDVTNNTYEFVAANLQNGVVYLDLVEFLEREELPEVALRYIEIKTARQLQEQKPTGPSQTGFTERDEFLARQRLVDDQGLVEDNNLLDSMSVYRTVFGRERGSPFNSRF
jgi:hypothetical protein